MAFDEALAERVRKTLARKRGVTERKMFGGIAFLLKGNMVCGVLERDLIVRLGKERHDAALKEPHTKPFTFTGTPLRGMVVVTPKGSAGASLRRWITRALDVVATLPRKKRKK